VEADDLLEINYNMFKKMKTLAEAQEKLASKDQMSDFLALANKRERLKSEISANNKRYNLLAKKAPAKSTKRKNIGEEIAEVIKSIQELDERIENLISDGKRRLMADISKMRKGRKAVRNYRGKIKNIPRFIERKG
jgi:chromosome segregation ATPase